MAEAIWIRARTINVTLSVYNFGRARMVRVTGPSGEAGMAPYNLDDHKATVEWVTEAVQEQLHIALEELDEEAKKLLQESSVSLNRRLPSNEKADKSEGENG